MNKKILKKILVILIILVAFILRVYRLGEIPRGINVDEAGMAYDAFSILHFRVDRYLNKLPVYFINFGGGQSVLYGYLTAIFIAIFGFTLKTFRLAQVIVSMVAIILLYFMFKKHLGENAAIVLIALITINPWNIMASRWGLDCNLFAPMMMISMFFLFRAEDKWYDYIFAGISFGITLYTYALSYLIMPIFLFFILLYMLYTKKITIKNIIFLGIPIFIFAIPLMLMILVNFGIIGEIKWLITIPKLPNYRGGEISFKNFFENIKNIDKILIYDNLPFNSIEGFGPLYIPAIPFAILGLVVEIDNFIKNFKNKEFKLNSAFLIFFISSFLFMMLVQSVNISKANVIYYPLVFLEYSGIQFLYSLKQPKKIINYIILVYIIGVFTISFVKFTYFYFNEYEIIYGEQFLFESDLVDSIRKVNGIEEYKNKKVYIFTDAREPYIYTLYANPISPYDYNSSKFGENNSYGRFEILSTNNRYIDEDGVYIVRVDTDFDYELVSEYGFNYEEVGTYKILFSP